jgi:hypothetical protein
MANQERAVERSEVKARVSAKAAAHRTANLAESRQRSLSQVTRIAHVSKGYIKEL